MRNVNSSTVLVLNASYEPIALCQGRRAITLIVKDRAHVQEDAGHEVYPGIMFPSVIRLKTMANIPRRVQVLTRKNIILRDHSTCQYCDKKFPMGELTLDHIIPQSRGGKDAWENLVACCSPCNRRKADQTPEEAGMFLRKRPRPSTVHTSRHILRNMGADDPLWKKYLFYDSSESTHVTRGSEEAA